MAIRPVLVRPVFLRIGDQEFEVGTVEWRPDTIHADLRDLFRMAAEAITEIIERNEHDADNPGR